MSTLFTKIIKGELPGKFVYRDERAVAFLSIHPIQPGHTLVVPIQEVDHWLEAEDDLLTHLHLVAKKIGRAQMKAFAPVKVGVMLAGLEVPHLHIHVVPLKSEKDLDFARADTSATSEQLEQAAVRLREALG